ncbi:MAG: caspase family protein, partial [Nostocaceae cyanobacterium]|nr:caspase family protein [Nostocaceae cyanobacterium]
MADFKRNLAFVIGINNYTNGIPHLQTAVNDAKKLVEILREKHGYQVWVCLDETATLKTLNNLLTTTLPQQVQADDRLLFYFAGHGVALNGDDGPEGYLIPQDAKLGDIQSYLAMTKLQEALTQLPCRHFLGIFDCCFAGAFRWSSHRDLLATPEVIHKERYDRLICDPAWQVITSSDYDQKAADAFVLRSRSQSGDHSPFAAALLDAFAGGADTNPPATDDQVAGDGITTATELYLYLRDRVELATEGNSQRQTPGIWPLKKHDKGEYIFLTPGHELNLPPAPPLDESKNPYRGLESFEEQHSQFFFGRDSLEDKLLDVVTKNPLTSVLGASGSGKSSLVKAGLIPKIRKVTTEKWCIVAPIRPGDTPFRSLNYALVNSNFPEVNQLAQKTLADRITEWISSNRDTKLLLVIDQSEELLTLCHHEEERQRFFSELAQAIATHSQQLRVVLTIRSDFEPQLRDSILQSLPKTLPFRNTIIKNHWQAARFIVPAMTRLQLRDAIEKPAELRVMNFEPHTLVDQLIDEVADMPGTLPLLSFALSELYLKYLKRQQAASNNGDTNNRAITQEDYDEMGGVTQSLTQRSDSEYEELVKENPAYSQIIRLVMLRMVAVGGGELARRQLPLSELKYASGKQELVEKVLERFSQARLLVQGQDAEGNTYVELAHGVLVRGWLKLRNWLQEEKNLRLQRRLTPAAMEWNSHKKAEFLWHADPYINVLHRDVLNSKNNNWLNQIETEFVHKSVQRKLNIIRSRWGISFAVIFGLIGLTSWALPSQRKSQFGEINSKLIS